MAQVHPQPGHVFVTYDPDSFAALQDTVALDSRSVLIFKEGQPATAQVGPELELSKQILDGLTSPNAVGEYLHFVICL